ECALVAILDADKEGFLRSETSLIQTIGRAARNIEGKVILYADKETKSIKKAIEETNRRRDKQTAFNKKNNITAQSIQKDIGDILQSVYEKDYLNIEKDIEIGHNLKKHLKSLKKDMLSAADNLEFEKAAKIRDEIKKLESSDLGLAINSNIKKYGSNNLFGRSTQGKAGTKVRKKR
ncbi:MAG: UvrB/UvrC motif-containing protein, partial [Pelagibacteraceae bacterium]